MEMNPFCIKTHVAFKVLNKNPPKCATFKNYLYFGIPYINDDSRLRYKVLEKNYVNT